MKVVVLGLWHLGSVTAACCAEFFQVTGLDECEDTIAQLQKGEAPIMEPGLNSLIVAGLQSGRLKFTTDFVSACKDADLLWVCDDTPVDENDVADVEFVLKRIRKAVPLLLEGTLVLISSQLPAGTCLQLQKEFSHVEFGCSPENLRLGKALEVFQRPERVVVGVSSPKAIELVKTLFKPFSNNLVLMSPTSAEMTKHALNGFLALSVAYINEVACLCERLGADASEVERGLKSERRIGPGAYLSPGGAFAGGTLARDVAAMTQLGEKHGEHLRLVPAIKESNDRHRGWAFRRLQAIFSDLPSKTVTVLGLTYKPGTDTLRRSSAVELCRELACMGIQVKAYDPVINKLPDDLVGVHLCFTADEALRASDAVVLCTQWPVFREWNWTELLHHMNQPVVLDATGFVRAICQSISKVNYYTVGVQK